MLKKGVSGRTWVLPEQNPRAVNAESILEARGVSGEETDAFLNPKLKDSLPNPLFLKDMGKAAEILQSAIQEKKKVGIYTDYDADGATSAGVLGRYVRMRGGVLHQVVAPDRKKHGYGPHKELVEGMFDNGCDVIFVLDSGTVAANVFDQMSEDHRSRICVIDHHMPAGKLPDIAAVVNPNREDQEPGQGHLAAVGVTFLLCVAANRMMVRDGQALPQSTEELMSLLDYVAVGTVCDVVPLVGINRAFVYQGIKRVNRDKSDPIGALLLVSGKPINEKLTSRDFGFKVGPRLNAEGRIGDSVFSAQYLLLEDAELIRAAADRMNETNAKRQDSEKRTTKEAMENIVDPEGLVKVAVTSGHEGVVGISASKLVGAHFCPSIVLTNGNPGEMKGSARSVDGFNIGEAIHRAHEKGIVIKGGGHEMAGGLTLMSDRVSELNEFINQCAAESEYGKDGVKKTYDVVSALSRISEKVINDFSVLEPFGRGNPEIEVVLDDLIVRSVRTMSEKHIKAFCESVDNADKKIDLILWNGIGTPLGDAILSREGERIVAAGKIEINSFNGKKTLQMLVDDVEASVGPEVELSRRRDVASI